MSKKLKDVYQVCYGENAGSNYTHLTLASAMKEAEEELSPGNPYHGPHKVLHICVIREVKQITRSKKK